MVSIWKKAKLKYFWLMNSLNPWVKYFKRISRLGQCSWPVQAFHNTDIYNQVFNFLYYLWLTTSTFSYLGVTLCMGYRYALDNEESTLENQVSPLSYTSVNYPWVLSSVTSFGYVLSCLSNVFFLFLHILIHNTYFLLYSMEKSKLATCFWLRHVTAYRCCFMKVKYRSQNCVGPCWSRAMTGEIDLYLVLFVSYL